MGGEDDVAAARQSQVVVLGWYCRWVQPAAEYHGDAACRFGGWCSVMMHLLGDMRAHYVSWFGKHDTVYV